MEMGVRYIESLIGFNEIPRRYGDRHADLKPIGLLEYN